MNKYQIAVSLVGPHIEDMAYQGAQALKRGADLLEFRLDTLTTIGLSAMKSLFPQTPRIVTCRHPLEASADGHKGYCGSEEARIAILQEAIDLGFEYVDVELRSIDTIRKTSSSKIIVSHHDFNGTPCACVLATLYETARLRGDIVKIATYANTSDDADTMLTFVQQHGVKGNLIGIAMGEHGKKTRIEGVHYGMPWTFACLDTSTASAPGQQTIEELRSAWS